MPATATVARSWLSDVATNRRQRRQQTSRHRSSASLTSVPPARRDEPQGHQRPVLRDAGPAVSPLTPPMAASMASQQTILLELFGRPPVAFHRALVDVAGSVTAALWLSHAVELSQQRGTTELDITQEACTDATGLTRREQETARTKLRQAGLIAQTRAGKRLRFTVQLHTLAAKLLAACEGVQVPSSAPARATPAAAQSI